MSRRVDSLLGLAETQLMAERRKVRPTEEHPIEAILGYEKPDAGDVIAKILSHQNPDGGFATAADVEHFGDATARSGYLPKHRGTIWQAIFLAQLGADPADPRVAKLGSYILDADYSPEHKVIGLTWERRSGRRRFDAIPCFVGNMVWALSKLGFAGDPRVRDCIDWLIRYQRFDDGDFSPPTTWPYHGSQERCFSAHSCFIGMTQAMKAMTVIPLRDRTGEVADFIRRGTEFILLHRVYQQSRGVRSGRHRSKSSATTAGKGLPIKKFYLEMGFPLTYWDDVLGILETLLLLGVKDPAMDDAIELVLSKRTEVPGTDGATHEVWPNERPVSASKMWTKIEGNTKESPWNTYRALRVLRM